MILYEDGVKIGSISEWKRVERFAEKKVVLGKEIVTRKPKDQCEFVSPKPVSWKKKLTILDNDGSKMILTEVKVKDATYVTATIDDVTYK